MKSREARCLKRKRRRTSKAIERGRRTTAPRGRRKFGAQKQHRTKSGVEIAASNCCGFSTKRSDVGHVGQPKVARVRNRWMRKHPEVAYVPPPPPPRATRYDYRGLPDPQGEYNVRGEYIGR
ncbi:MAG: hypothetical protein PHZ00_06310 [Candidatus Peribacteraceae bacterium]|nr:hypothetical protein [Candidatus Peribacteraceae bacterium]